MGKYYLEHYVGKYENVYVPLILSCKILCLQTVVAGCLSKCFQKPDAAPPDNTLES